MNGRRNFDLLLIAVLMLGLGLSCVRAIADEPEIHAWVAIKGASMLPTYPDLCFIEITLGVPYSDLKPGKIVIRRTHYAACPLICHRLIAKRGDGWITKGDNNAQYDSEWMRERDYIVTATGQYKMMLIASPLIPRSQGTQAKPEEPQGPELVLTPVQISHE